MTPKYETRRFLSGVAQVRNADNGDENTRVLEGYALKWDDTYDIFDDGSLIESFRKGAFADTLKEDKQALLVEHSGPALSSTQNDTLEFEEDKTGLRFSATLDLRDMFANSAFIRTDNGTSTGVSVGFWIGDYERNEMDDSNVQLIHTNVRHLFEVSLVHNPAYTSSEVDVARYRAIMDAQAQEKEALAEQERIRQEQIRDSQEMITDMRVRMMQRAV